MKGWRGKHSNEHCDCLLTHDDLFRYVMSAVMSAACGEFLVCFSSGLH